MADAQKVVVELTGTVEFRQMEADCRELRAVAGIEAELIYLRSRLSQAREEVAEMAAASLAPWECELVSQEAHTLRTERDTARGIAMRLEEELAQTREALTLVADAVGEVGTNLRAGAIAMHTFLASEE